MKLSITGSTLRRAAAALGAGALMGLPAWAAAPGIDVDFAVSGIRSDSGTLRAVLCTSAERYPDGCRLSTQAPARVVGSKLRFGAVPPGTYAFAVYHDEDSNGRLTMGRSGWPTEGIGFSNDAIGPSGAPSFKAAALEVKAGAQPAVKLRYLRR